MFGSLARFGRMGAAGRGSRRGSVLHADAVYQGPTLAANALGPSHRLWINDPSSADRVGRTRTGRNYVALADKAFSDVFTFSRNSVAYDEGRDGLLGEHAAHAIRAGFSGGVPQGYLIEGGSVNYLRNARQEGSAVPNTPPTHMAFGPQNGISIEVVGSGAEQNLPFVDYRFFGTATATAFCNLWLEANMQVPTAPGEAVRLSAWHKLVSGSAAGVTFRFAGTEASSDGTYLQSSTTVTPASLPAPTSTLTRVSAAVSPGHASVAWERPVYGITVSSGATVDFVVRLACPMAERNNYYASSLMLPAPGSPATSSRAGDALSIQGSAFQAIWGAGKSVTNRATESAAFDAAVWTKTNATVVANAAAAPDGATAADRVTDDTAAGAHSVSQSVAWTAGTPVTISVYAKADTINWLRIGLPSTAFGASVHVYFDLSTGAVGTVSAAATASVVAVGSGWYRCSATATPTASTTAVLTFALADTNGAATYMGTGTGSLLLWGAMYETAPASLPAGNLIAHPESMEHSSWVKAGAGTGTAPVVTSQHGVAPDGSQSAEMVALALNAGTTTADQSHIAMGISATVGIGRTFAVYMKTTDGSSKSIRMDWAGTTPTTGTTGGLVTVTGTWQRFVITLDNPTATGQQPFIRLRGAQSTADAASLHIWGATLQEGTDAAAPAVMNYTPLSRLTSSYVPTTTAAVTKTFPEQGWCIVEAALNQIATASDQPLFSLDDGTTQNRIVARNHVAGGGANLSMRRWITNAATETASVGSITPGTAFRIGVRFDANGAVCAANGGAPLTILGAVQGLSILRLGLNIAGSNFGNCRIRGVWAGSTITDSQLQQATVMGADVGAIVVA